VSDKIGRKTDGNGSSLELSGGLKQTVRAPDALAGTHNSGPLECFVAQCDRGHLLPRSTGNGALTFGVARLALATAELRVAKFIQVRDWLTLGKVDKLRVSCRPRECVSWQMSSRSGSHSLTRRF